MSSSMAMERVDKRTGEVLPPEPAPALVPSKAAAVAVPVEPFPGIGELALTAADAQALTAPLPDEDVDILPSGEPFVAQFYVRDRLNRVFGPGAWGLKPM